MLDQNRKPRAIDASNPDEVHQTHAFKPLLIDTDQAWHGIHFFNQQVLIGETVETRLMQSVLIVLLGQCVADRWLDDKFQHEQQTIGDCFLIPQGAAHRAYKYMDVESVGIVIEPQFLKRIALETFDQPSVELVPRFCHADPFIFQLVLELKADLAAGCPTGRLYGEALATTLIAYLIRCHCGAAHTPHPYAGGLSKLQLQQAKEYIEDHLTQNVSIAAIAQHLDISQYYFIRLFKQSTGLTPHQYVMQRRLDVAKQLLAIRDLSIAQISDRLGFSDPSQFTHFFRKQVGVSPKLYRQGTLPLVITQNRKAGFNKF